MATIKFLTKGKNDPQTIYVRLRDGRKIDFTGSTGLDIKRINWSSTKNWIIQRADFKDKQNVENSLLDLQAHIHSERNERVGKGLPLTRDWFNTLLEKWQGKASKGFTDELVFLLEQYKEGLKHRVRNGKTGVANTTIRSFNSSIRRLEKFEKAQKKTYRAIEVDLTFHKKYIHFAKHTLNLAPNSIGKDIKQIKTVCLNAADNGIVINEQVRSRNFSAPSEKTVFTTLNRVELERIKNVTGSNYIENARDWLLIGCWTGCRVGDLMELTKKNVVIHRSGAKVIQYTQKKTGKLVNVPMHDDIQEIINRLGCFPRAISSVKFNKYIKEVCELAGLTYTDYGTRLNPITRRNETGKFEKWQLIKSHSCRRSFATNHYNKLPNKVIMMVTGHATEKMLLAYIGETEVEHVDDFINLWESEKQNENLMVKGA